MVEVPYEVSLQTLQFLAVKGTREKGKQGSKNTYRYLKVCVECVTSLINKVSSDDIKVIK